MSRRVDRDRALQQPTRRSIYEAIASRPGIRVGTLGRLLGLAHHTVEAHVRTLHALGYLVSHGPNQPRWFVRDHAPDPATREAAVACGAPAAREVLDHLAWAGPCELGTLARALGRSKSTVSGAASRLAAAGVVTKRRLGGRLVLSLRAQPLGTPGPPPAPWASPQASAAAPVAQASPS